MDSQSLLQEISGYCRRVGMAESTFGRLAVNDGKLVSRLRFGGRVTVETVERVRTFIGRHKGAGEAAPPPAVTVPVNGATPAPAAAASTEKNFRFFDNRQKYLLFVNTCSEKWVVAERVGLEIASIHPRPPGVRVFDAGIGDGTVLERVMRTLHH
ncbi:MAG TPA: hypothetical protein VN899_08945, partial [Stellaceae bacterium]|nr:hypothetical protein [Stellaceae bacterium]